ncbi:MAG: hypothetical protein HZA61_10485 [Candidatus Eisenbacteria bacterium]|uniref:Uncharacterized protein n=1 Tax=Eiseniibacteriota bacterium TaxID=2212470 RepID=A0A933SDV8_UNCEI|nr:hypothetical protein [Candidatus Eisenbacteria bacterium]
MNLQGRHQLFFAAHPCGHETWRVERDARGAEHASGRSETHAPHPMPGVIEWSAACDESQRVTALEVRWQVGAMSVHAKHAAGGTLDAQRWTVQLEYGGNARTQEGDYPSRAHVVFGSPVLQSWVLRRFALAPGAEHAFPALVVGPPWMMVEPGQHTIRCTAAETRETCEGPRTLQRVEWTDPATPDAGELMLWIDGDDVVHEAWEGAGAVAPSAKLVELRRD